MNEVLITSDLDTYMRYVKSIPQLNKEEEYFLAKKLYVDGCTESAKKLILANLRFVVWIAHKYKNYKMPLEDIIQEGNIGLMKAIKRFNPDIGVRLVTFAVHWIKAEINEYIIKNFSLVKTVTTKAQRKLFFNLKKMRPSIDKLSREDIIYIAKELNVSTDDVILMEQRLTNKIVSFDNYIDENGEEDFSNPIYYLTDSTDIIESIDNEKKSSEQLIEMALNGLSDREIDIIRSRYLTEQPIQLVELSKKYNVSFQRI
uniref:RNA polymerase factor sigma-32 n=1 Tax=Flavobacterium sp. TaxID=239 RepID=UPI0026127726